MFPSFIGILDIQSWWEVPSIAHFCSLFRAAFNLLDFDIEELEEALLTDGTEECASSLLTELIVRLLCGCLGNNDISAFNYQMFLRRLFRQKCQETGRYNPFNTDIDFQFLPLRTKVEILYALCDFRLDAGDVFELFKNLEAESLRVEPLGWDDNSSAYWYFYGTRLYREDYKIKTKGKKRKVKEGVAKRKGDVLQSEEDPERVWQVICFTESDWIHLTDKFRSATSRIEKDLFNCLSENFCPVINRIFQDKERLQRKRCYLWCLPLRTSTRIQSINKQKEDKIKEQKSLEYTKQQEQEAESHHKSSTESAMRESRARRREKKRSHSVSSSGSGGEQGMRGKGSGRGNGESPPAPRPHGRQTNNSLACATNCGPILIPDVQPPPNPTRKKMKTSQIYELMQEDVQTDMYKVLEQLKGHEDAWPFMDPVEEDYAPNYYSVIRRPMDLQRMEERLDQGHYSDLNLFKNDFRLIVNNCRLYNGQDNEYTEMVDKLEIAFNKLTERYFDRMSSSDDEIAVEYPMQNPSPRKQKEKGTNTDFEVRRKRKRVDIKVEDCKDSENSTKKATKYENKSTETEQPIRKKIKVECVSAESSTETEHIRKNIKVECISAESNHSDISSHKSLEKIEKKSKKSKIHSKRKKKTKSLRNSKSRKEKRQNKKIRQKRKHSKLSEKVKKKKSSRRLSFESQRSRSSCRSPDNSSVKEEFIPKKRHQSPEIDFYKDKFDKIKERRRGSSKNNFDTDGKSDKAKSNLLLPEKDKNLKLKETIEKLKAKSEKCDSPIYQNMFESKTKSDKKHYDDSDGFMGSSKSKSKVTDEYEFIDDSKTDDTDSKTEYSLTGQKKVPKKQSNAKNESATEALEQAVKDISKWLDDTPKLTEFSSNSNSPSQMIHSEESLSTLTRLEDDNSCSQQEKEKSLKKDSSKKKQQKDATKGLARRKEVQRTIERLQPGKSKGNLISNIQIFPKVEENVPVLTTNKIKEVKSSLIMKTEEGSPKLSLGTVLPTVGFGLGKQHNFTQESNPTNVVKVEVVDTGTMTCETEEIPAEIPQATPPVVVETVEVPKADVEIEKPSALAKQCQEKATPNLSAWFKAFGAPKSGSAPTKKKFDDIDQEDIMDGKTTSPIDNIKSEQSVDDSLIPEGGESPIANLTSGGRPRRTSTGSSVSERSSFSQDLDSPRHQPSHPSPLLRSPASPRTEDHQKTYPLMNVTVRVGFYQDTASVKSSPEKSCSPREAPQSPYSAYSQHVYAASGNSANSANQSQSASGEGSCKSPLPYGQSQPQAFYDSGKVNQSNKDYTTFGSETVYQQPSSPFSGPFSPAQSPYSHHSQHSPYSHSQHSPQTFGQPTAISNVIQSTENRNADKPAVFPVKKRSYNDHSAENSMDIGAGLRKSPVFKSNEKLSISSSSRSSTFFDEEKSTTCSVIQNNNPSVITSTAPMNIKKSMQLSYASKVDQEALKLPTYMVDSVERLSQNPEMYSQFTDVASDYSARKCQVNDFSLVGLSKSHSESANIYQDTGMPKHMSGSSLFSEVKNASEIASKDFSMRNKSIDMINMGYNNKFVDNSKVNDINVDMVNMGYLMPDSGNTDKMNMSKVDSNINESTSQRSFHLYNMACNIPFSNPSDQIGKSVLNVASGNEFIDKGLSNKQTYNKSHSVLHYPSSSMDMSRSGNIDMSINRADTSSKLVYPDNTSRPSVIPTYKDWNVDTIKKSIDAHNLSAYKDIQEKTELNKTNVSQAIVSSNQKKNSDNIAYEDLNESEDSIQKLQPELRIPIIRAIIEISSSIKPENQQPAQTDYSPRSKNINVNMPLHSIKSVENNFDRNIPTSSVSGYKSQQSHTMDSSLRNIPNIPQIVEKYVKDDRMLSAYPSGLSPYHDKSMSMGYHKNIHNSVSANQMYQPVSMPMAYSRESTYSPNIQANVHNLSVDTVPAETEKKNKSRKKKASIETSAAAGSSQSFHSYGSLKSGLTQTTEQAAIALKSSNILPGSAFNFGPPGLYDSSSYLEAGGYLPREDKGAPFPFLPPPAGYPLVDPALYQQYLQRHQAQLLRHSTSHMMAIFPPTYPTDRQPYHSLPRPSWL